MHRERCEMLAQYIIEHGATVRKTANKFGISKSTVHKDISDKLPKVNRHMYDETKPILEKNRSERHLRGGEATKKKYAELKIIRNNYKSIVKTCDN